MIFVTGLLLFLACGYFYDSVEDPGAQEVVEWGGTLGLACMAMSVLMWLWRVLP